MRSEWGRRHTLAAGLSWARLWVSGGWRHRRDLSPGPSLATGTPAVDLQAVRAAVVARARGEYGEEVVDVAPGQVIDRTALGADQMMVMREGGDANSSPPPVDTTRQPQRPARGAASERGGASDSGGAAASCSAVKRPPRRPMTESNPRRRARQPTPDAFEVSLHRDRRDHTSIIPAARGVGSFGASNAPGPSPIPRCGVRCPNCFTTAPETEYRPFAAIRCDDEGRAAHAPGPSEP